MNEQLISLFEFLQFKGYQRKKSIHTQPTLGVFSTQLFVVEPSNTYDQKRPTIHVAVWTNTLSQSNHVIYTIYLVERSDSDALEIISFGRVVDFVNYYNERFID